MRVLNKERFLIASPIDLFLLLAYYSENILAEKFSNLPKNASSPISNNMSIIVSILEYLFLQIEKDA